jgi:hypothetical protein
VEEGGVVPAETGQSTPEVLARFLDAGERLVEGRLLLARTELEARASQAGRQLSVAAMALVPAVVGWALWCAALCVGLMGALGLVGSLLLVGALNLGASMALLMRGVRARPLRGGAGGSGGFDAGRGNGADA